MTRLSVNVNKVATLRNARGGNVPDLGEAVRVILDAGARGITIHPRQDERHITRDDIHRLAELLAPRRADVEFNIEGDPRPDLLEELRTIRPHQCTLVPVVPGEITSQAGWRHDETRELGHAVAELRDLGIRVSLFIDPTPGQVRWAAECGADRVELYTEPFARAFEYSAEAASRVFAQYKDAAQCAHELGLGVNAGHDLDLKNLVMFRDLPHLDEVSIGHALLSRALFVGLEVVVGEYLSLLSHQVPR